MRFVPLFALTALPIAAVAAAQGAPVTRTPAGAYVQGSARAPVKLVEYISYTCPHCGHYIVEAATPTAAKIKAGQLSVELRHATRDPLDLTAALLARCGGGSRFFGNTEAIMTAQPQWLPRAGQWLESNGEAWEKQDTNTRLKSLAEASGLNAILKARGYSQAQLNACLADGKEQALLAGMGKASWGEIKSTPSFRVNGTLQGDVHSWTDLQPKLTAAGMR